MIRGEQALFNLEIKKKRGLSKNLDIHHSKVFSSGKKILHVIWIILYKISYKIKHLAFPHGNPIFGFFKNWFCFLFKNFPQTC